MESRREFAVMSVICFVIVFIVIINYIINI